MYSGMEVLTVKKLIEQLQECPSDAKVYVYAHTDLQGGVYCKFDADDSVSVSDDKSKVELICYED
jgi:hypothetical protein